MSGIYEQYAKFRPELTDGEKDTLNRRGEGELSDNHGQIIVAKKRAERQFSEWVNSGYVYPDDPEITEKYPGIDPKGCACEVDMSFANRVARLKAALPSRPLMTMSYVGQRLSELEDLQSRIYSSWQEMEFDCRKIQLNQRAAKLAVTQESSDWLLDQADDYAREGNGIQTVNMYLNVLEYAAGLTDREPTLQERAFLKRLEAPLDEAVERRRHDSLTQPLKVEVEFTNFDNQVQQKFFSSPLAWEKKPADTPNDVARPEAVEGAISRYAAATADRALDPLFEHAEKITQGKISRADLITVDGKTVKELMAERFREMESNETFETWYGKNVRQMTNDLVSAGLMAGKRVEAFVPDKNGRIPKEPAQVVKTGYTPSPLKKVTLNAWERHFAKHGFYKEKAAKAVEYQNVMAARERVQLKNMETRLQMNDLSSPRVKDMFFGEWQKETGEPLPEKVPGNYTVHRSALSTFAICGLAAKGYSIEEIMNPDLLQKEKADMGREVIENLTRNGSESEIEERKRWEAETLYNGRKKLNEQLDRICENFDLTDTEKIFSEESIPMYTLGSVLFDLSQEEDRVDKQKYEAVAKADVPDRDPKETIRQLFDHADSFCNYMQYAKNTLTSRCIVTGTEVNSGFGIDRALSEMGRFEYARRLYAEEKAKNPGVQPYLGVKAADFQLVSNELAMTDSFNDAVRKSVLDPKMAASLKQAAVRGDILQRINVQYNSKHEISFEISESSKKTAKKEERSQKLEEAVRKNQEKADKKQVKKSSGRSM